MKVVIDTSIWSVVMRRDNAKLNPLELVWKSEFVDLFHANRIALIEPVRQELLSGVRHEKQYQKLKKGLRGYTPEPLFSEDYEEAAVIHNKCLSHGYVPYSIDCLICAVTLLRGWQLFTADKDFIRFKDIIGLGLYECRRSQ